MEGRGGIELTGGTLLFYGGIAGMALAAVGAVTAAVILRFSGKNLNRQLEKEFGKKKH